MESTTVTISKRTKTTSDGQMLKMVVIKTPAGKNKKGKQIFTSRTRHIPV